jgi:hypothetical protein
MSERSEMIAWIRGELVGPSRPIADPSIVEFVNREFVDLVPLRRGPLAWQPDSDTEPQEVLYYDGESPHRKYGAGLLHPVAAPIAAPAPDQAAVEATDTIGVETESDDAPNASDGSDAANLEGDSGASDTSDDFEVISADVRHPSTIGISFCVHLFEDGRIIVRLPQSRRFPWQGDNARPFPLNGRYESCLRRWTDEHGNRKNAPIWRRRHAVPAGTEIVVNRSELTSGRTVRKPVTMPKGSPIELTIEAFPRQLRDQDGAWLVTVVLRNLTSFAGTQRAREEVLYQAYFEVVAERGSLQKYPESQRPFNQLDREEQSLALLYRDSATWGIGHGCAAGWDAEPGQVPSMLPKGLVQVRMWPLKSRVTLALLIKIAVPRTERSVATT